MLCVGVPQIQRTTPGMQHTVWERGLSSVPTTETLSEECNCRSYPWKSPQARMWNGNHRMDTTPMTLGFQSVTCCPRKQSILARNPLHFQKYTRRRRWRTFWNPLWLGHSFCFSGHSGVYNGAVSLPPAVCLLLRWVSEISSPTDCTRNTGSEWERPVAPTGDTRAADNGAPAREQFHRTTDCCTPQSCPHTVFLTCKDLCVSAPPQGGRGSKGPRMRVRGPEELPRAESTGVRAL